MSDTKGPDTPGAESSQSKAQIISLCAHRERRAIEVATDQLVDHLELIHHRAIQVHNAVIERAEVSVLTELCRTAGLFLDLVDEMHRGAVLIPAALYGDSGGDVFGKKPLQKRIEDDIDDPGAADVLAGLNRTRLGIWEYEPREDEPTDRVVPLAGPSAGEPTGVAGMIGPCGAAVDDTGVYVGRRISYRGRDFIVFGHRLDRAREVAIRNMLDGRDDRYEHDFWQRAELRILRTVVDPDGVHRQPGADGRRRGGRQPTSRNGLLLSIRRALWRRFAEPDEGLTIHAHIAALADDSEAFDALVDDMCQIADTVTLRSGGLREGVAPVGIDEVLRPFHVDGRGRLLRRGRLRGHPLGVLLVSPELIEEVGLDESDSIAEALEWASEAAGPTGRAIELAWMTYRTEQNLVATYGRRVGRPEEPGDEQCSLSFARRSPVLPNIRTLFEPRFMETSLDELRLDPGDRYRLFEGLIDDREPQDLTLVDLGTDERQLARTKGIGHETCNAVRDALLELATHWRWRRAGMAPEDFSLDAGGCANDGSRESSGDCERLDRQRDD